ncbi:MAG: AAA family ATPase [Bacilli bacterium]|nr:AAA family ATPase [Bacilli bacterium]
MKRITKLRLINWHFFENEEIQFGMINVITGENGSGKSTILDAIHYLQSGGTCKFNQAANTLSSGRTVANYLRARTGAEDQEFLRDSGDIIGHIAAEYYDETRGAPFVLGCVLQLVKGTMADPRFYTITNGTYSNSIFFGENSVRNFDELFSKAKEEGLEIEEVGRKLSEKRRRLAVLRALGNPEKYEILFTKALSFEPLQDIGRFATDFLLPEAELDLSSIKSTMDSYRLIQDQLREETKRMEILKPIADSKDTYESLKKKRFGFQILEFNSQIDVATEQIRRDRASLEIEKAQAAAFEKDNQANLEKANKANLAADLIANSEEYKALAQLDASQREAKVKHESLKNDVKLWESMMENESSLARRIGTSLDFSLVKKSKDYPSLVGLLTKYSERVEDIYKSVANDRGALQNRHTSLTDSIRDLDEEILQLQANAYAFPVYVEQLMAAIRKKAKEEKGVANIQIFPLCSQLEINDPEWRDAVEGILGKRRFDLFVPKSFIPLASKVFASSGLQDYFGVGVIAFDDKEEAAVLPNAISWKVSAWTEKDGERRELKEPRAYIDRLLGDIMLVEGQESFKPGRKAITKEGLYFDGSAVRHLLYEDMSKPYIGQESIKRRLADDLKRKEALVEEMKDVNKKIADDDRIINETRCSNVKAILDRGDLWREFQSIDDELRSINDQIAKLKGSNNEILGLSGLIEERRKEAALAREAAMRAGQALSASNIKIGEISKELETLHDKIESLAQQKREKIEEQGMELSILDEYLAALSEGKKGKELRDFVAYSKGPNENEIKRLERIITNAMSAYVSAYPNELKLELDNYIAFVQRYNKIVGDELAKLTPEVENAKNRSELELREHFISRIRASLNDAKQSIDSLNRTLRNHPFGSDKEVFEFKGTKNSDPLLGGVYHIAIETNQDSIVNDLFSEDLDHESQEVLQTVFDILSTREDDPEYKERRLEITDYRNYLNYDIKITMNDGDSVLYYSKNQDSKSGGETQTPFYALIAGAFQSLLALPEKQLDSPSSLVCFDEAFNNMDGERIRQMLEFYKELRIQLIISVPSIRFAYISPYADNIISLAKIDGQVGIFTAIKNGN